jgi:hypothetical protein
MGAPRSRDVFADLERAQDVIKDAPAQPAPSQIEDARNVTQITRQPETDQLPAAPSGQGGGLDLNRIRAMKTRKEPTIQTNARLPMSLIDDIDLIRSLTGTSATDIITEGTRREVARLKKLHGLE